MENPQYEQLKLFYTQEEVDAKVSEAVTDGVQALHRANARVSSDLRDKAIAWFKNEVREGNMIKEDALGIFNGLAGALGWNTVDSLTSTYSVTVMYDGTEIALFQEVEADDEDDACNKVLEDMNIESVTISFDIFYGGSNESGEVEISSWDLDNDRFTAEANEE